MVYLYSMIKSNKNISYGLLSTSKNRLYNIYHKIKARCFNENCIDFPYYGGRGITVFEDWLNDFFIFRNWALSNGYSDDLSIERVNVNGNYTPDNCTWENDSVQANNKRTYSNNTSGFRGVVWHGRIKKWHAKVPVNGKYLHIGYYDDKLIAAKERNEFIINKNLPNKLNII